MSIEHEVPLGKMRMSGGNGRRAVLFPRRGYFQPTGAFEDISLGELRQPITEEWRIPKCIEQTAS